MQKPALAVHAGTPKTGTTAAQLALLHGTQALDALNFSYPLGSKVVKNPERFTGNAAATARGLASLSGDEKHPKVDTFLARHRAMKKDMASLPATKNAVLSSEFFSGFSPKSWTLFFKEFSPDHYDVSVIYYIRNQLDQIQSALGQSVKGGRRVNPVAFGKRAVEQKRFLDYAGLLDTLRTFPFQTCILRPYDRKLLVEGDIGCDLFAQLATLVGASSNIYQPDSGQDRNLSLSAKGVHVKNFFNKTKPKTDENDALLAALHKVNFGDRTQPASYIDPSEVFWISQLFKDGNALLVKELGEDFDTVANSKTAQLPLLDISVRPPQSDIDMAMDALYQAAPDSPALRGVVKRIEPFAIRRRSSA